ncbi:Tigger transposable element-derived protein 2 [Dictyocoela muelleri]|nr:Tigger transposable element-derived protein 2 [Dictyocoela muelleri]
MKLNYNEKDIYNIDETCLFIKSPANRSYAEKNDSINNKLITKIKTIMAILLTVNAMGNFFNTLIIGNSKDQRALKNKILENLYMVYTSNKTAWVTKENF